MAPSVAVTTVTVGAFAENCHLVTDTGTMAMAVVDPGSEPDRILDAIERSGARPVAIWVTHAHVDHIGAIASVERVWDVPVFLHPLDEPLYRGGETQAALYGLPFEKPPTPDHPLADGDTLTLGDLSFVVMHVPGHAPGHVVIHGNGIALAGDCLFAGSIGRSDLPFSDPQQLARSLERIAALPSETVVYPGHGPSTTIGRERSTNPFLTGSARIVGST